MIGRTDGRKRKQENPTNCETEATDVLDTFLAGKHNSNHLNIFVYFQLLCTQRGKELGFRCRMKSVSRQSKAHS